MKNAMKILLTLLVLTLASGMIYSQTLPSTMKPHGTNSLNVVTPAENIDSVTVSGTYEYFVMPDPAINVGYNPSVNLLTNLVDTFSWSTYGATSISQILSGGTPVPNYVRIVWNGAAGSADTVYVTEKTKPAGCVDASPSKIPVKIINRPQAYFTSTSGSTCSSNPTSVSIVYPFTLSTDVNDGNIRVHVTITAPSGATLIDQDVNLNEASATTFTFNNTSSEYGTYTATITTVSDRITRKAVTGTVTGIVGNSGANTTYAFTINRIPQTGTIYHIPNM